MWKWYFGYLSCEAVILRLFKALLCLQTLAVGSHDNKVYLYNTVDFTAKAKIRKSSSYITHLDFSADSVFVQTNDGAYELLYYDAETGIQVGRRPTLR